MAKIAKYFSAKEFRCPGSGILFVDPDLLDMLDRLRELMGEPVYITSGCRSPEHNAKIGGSAASQHITTELTPCRAADIKAVGANRKYRLVQSAIDLGFGGIGVYKTHIHLDTRDMPVMWRG